MKAEALVILAGAVLVSACGGPPAEPAGSRVQAERSAAPPPAAETIGPIAYTCDPAGDLSVTYINAADGLGQARATLDGVQYMLDQVRSGSGARYMADEGRSPGATLVWWNKGTGGTLLEGRVDDPAAEEVPFAECTQAD